MGVTFAHRVAYLGGVCCRSHLFSAVRLPSGGESPRLSLFSLATRLQFP